MNDIKKTELFETMPIPKAAAKLCIPTVMTSLVMILYNLADTFFVGELNDAAQNAGVTLAAPVILAFNAVTNLFGVGTSSKMSRSLGEKDYDTVKKSAAFGFYCALFAAALMSVLCTLFRMPLLTLLGSKNETLETTSGYMFWTVTCGAVPTILSVSLGNFVRAEGASSHAGIGIMSGCILNIILDPFFILPQFLGMGAAGAGLATFISNCVACIYFFILLYAKRKTTYVSINPRDFGFRKDIAKDIFGVGLPASIQNLLNVTGMTVLNNFTAAAETYNSEAAVAAMGIAHKIGMVPMYVSMGLSQGLMPLVGYNYASKDIDRMKKSIIYVLKWSMVLNILLTSVLVIFPGTVVSVFLNDPDVISYGSAFLRGQALALPFLCLDFFGVAIFQACGKGLHALFFAIARKIILEIPALIVLNMIFPLYGLAYAQFVAEVVLAVVVSVVLVIMIKRLEKKN